MIRLPEIKPKQLRKILLARGFLERTGKGSHRVFAHHDGRRTVLSMHNKPLTVGTLRAILKQIDLSVEELVDEL
ncbi:MAG: type II toxin-antitoxin system HicA family toxin [Patescibacteria group bacterium]